MNDDQSKQRIDKWLWAARFFKTRSMASEAVAGGKVHADGLRAKPARQVGPGTQLRIRKDSYEWDVVILAVSKQRGSATVARTLYEETPQSLAVREREITKRREQRAVRAVDPGRPDKKGRRVLMQMKRVENRGEQ